MGGFVIECVNNTKAYDTQKCTVVIVEKNTELTIDRLLNGTAKFVSCNWQRKEGETIVKMNQFGVLLLLNDQQNLETNLVSDLGVWGNWKIPLLITLDTQSCTVEQLGKTEVRHGKLRMNNNWHTL